MQADHQPARSCLHPVSLLEDDGVCHEGEIQEPVYDRHVKGDGGLER